MNIIITFVILIELLFLIFGSFYLIKKTKIRHLYKYIMMLIYLSVLILINIIVVDLFHYSFYKNKSLIENIEKIENKIEEKEVELEELSNEINNKEIKELQEKLNNITTEINEYKEEFKYNENILKDIENNLKELEKEYEELYKKKEYFISPFPTYNQFPNYPNGCESVALHLLLKYNGVDVSVESIVEKLKKGDRPFSKNGKLYGGDPEVEFVGDPRSKNGYGVYEKPIIDVAEQFKSGIKNITGSSLENVLDIVRTGKPVQVWASINLRDTYVCSTWTSTSTKRTIKWLCGLHSLVVIGYNYESIITSDPYTGKIEYYDKTQFEKIYNTYGKRAIYYE